jgi:hypothetical protein
LFFYAWGQRRNQPGIKTALLYGLLGALMALIRPQDGLVLPFLSAVLFLAFRGLFTWHLVFLLALLRLLLTYHKHCSFAVLGLLGFVMQWYIISTAGLG